MSKKSLIKSASIISIATLISRILGFLRDMLIAKTFGIGWFAQAFFVAFRLPNMFRELAAEGASNAAFVPVFSEYLATKPKEELWKLINTVFIAFVAVVSAIAMIGIFFSPLLVRVIAPGFIEIPEKLQLTIAINRFLFGYLILISIAAFCMGVLYTFKSFLSPSLSPSIFNLVVIASIMSAHNSISGIWRLVVGVIIAGIFQIVIQIPSLLKHGFRLRPFIFQTNIWAHAGVRTIGRLLVPRIIGTAVYQLNILVDTVFASFSFLIGPGAIAAIYYATRMIQFPLGIFAHSISNATLPVLSEFAAKKQMREFSKTVEFSLTNILFVMIPATFGFLILSKPIIKLIFERGEFTQYSTTITSIALAFYAIGLGAYAANKFFAISFNALQDTITPVKISGLALGLNIALNILFVVVLKTKIAGLAFASSLSAIISSFIFHRSLKKLIGQGDSQEIKGQILRMLLAATIMAIAIFVTWQRLAIDTHPALGLFVTICLGIVVYILVSFFLKIYQATRLFKWILELK